MLRKTIATGVRTVLVSITSEWVKRDLANIMYIRKWQRHWDPLCEFDDKIRYSLDHSAQHGHGTMKQVWLGLQNLLQNSTDSIKLYKRSTDWTFRNVRTWKGLLCPLLVIWVLVRMNQNGQLQGLGMSTSHWGRVGITSLRTAETASVNHRQECVREHTVTHHVPRERVHYRCNKQLLTS